MNKLHSESLVLDSHCDTPLMILENSEIWRRTDRGHLDFERMIEGGVDAVFFAIYTSASLSADIATTKAVEMISRIYDIIDRNNEKVALALSVQDARINKGKSIISIFLGMENAAPIHKDLCMLRFFYKFGIRYITLCHSADNQVCDSCTSTEKRWDGLSPFGKELIVEMNRLGMMVDCSHASDKAFYDMLESSKTPIVATHSSCRALCNHPRNMTDDMIMALAKKGGVIQINFYPLFLDKTSGTQEYWILSEDLEHKQDEYQSDLKNLKKKQEYIEAENKIKSVETISYKVIVDHIDHVVGLVGVEYVGLGSDFDGIDITPKGMDDISKFPLITEELLHRGYLGADIKKILGGNFLRVMKEIEKYSKSTNNIKIYK